MNPQRPALQSGSLLTNACWLSRTWHRGRQHKWRHQDGGLSEVFDAHCRLERILSYWVYRVSKEGIWQETCSAKQWGELLSALKVVSIKFLVHPGALQWRRRHLCERMFDTGTTANGKPSNIAIIQSLFFTIVCARKWKVWKWPVNPSSVTDKLAAVEVHFIP